ncbi:hypothetical protein F5146DRAFT_1073341 [Armillaria mellea]|nr:hypothetical protein F5146DRAFT_1073341 [Armillaria mellea]
MPSYEMINRRRRSFMDLMIFNNIYMIKVSCKSPGLLVTLIFPKPLQSRTSLKPSLMRIYLGVLHHACYIVLVGADGKTMESLTVRWMQTKKYGRDLVRVYVGAGSNARFGLYAL